jgi:L-asparagine transporter-like permease
MRAVVTSTRSALIFFAYIGFDSISAAAEECNNPQRDLPIGSFIERSMCQMHIGPHFRPDIPLHT